MKKIIVLFASIVILLGLSCCSSNKVGNENFENQKEYIKNSVLDSIKSSWNSILLDNDIHSKLTSFEVKEGSDIKNKNAYYYLIGKSTNDLVKVATLLKLVNKRYSPYSNSKYPLAICYGCIDCYPIFSYDIAAWECETNNDSCKKIEVMSSK